MDLRYPTYLHDRHDYPLAPESLVIDRSMYSSTQQAVFPESVLQRKLAPNLRDKVKYVVHYRNLKLYIQLSLVVTKVHQVLTFKQSPWLKTYLDFNTRQCSSAGNSFLKDFFKLMNKCFWEHAREFEEPCKCRTDYRRSLFTDGLLNRISTAGNPITGCLTVVQCTVLELSKLHMHDFHYNHVCVKYPRADQLRLFLTDTDSLAHVVQADGIYRDMVDDAASLYDFCEYPVEHTFNDKSNRKALGFFKDELNSVPMREFVVLRQKCYAFLCTGKVDNNVFQHTKPVEKKTAKGVKRKVKDDHLHFAHYLDLLHSFKSYICKLNLISSTNHTVRTVHTRKVGLTAFDRKRWMCEDTVHTHSHGQAIGSFIQFLPCQLLRKCGHP